jgi:hypothetical protein
VKSWYSYLLILVLPLHSCTDEADSPMFSEEKVVEVLADLHIAEAFLEHAASEMRDSLRIEYRAQISEIHGVDLEAFDVYVDELRAEPLEYERIYKLVVDRLELMQEGNMR